MMKLFGYELSLRKTKAQSLSGVDNRGWHVIQESFGGAWQRDVVIDKEVVLSNWTVFACMTLIAGDVGKMPPRLMQPNGDIWVQTSSPAFSPVLRKPNGYQTWQKFIESWVLSKLSSGNTYVLKEYDARRVVVAMHVLDPNRVRPLVSQSGDVYYELQDDELAGLPEGLPAVPASEIIHDRMWCLYHPLVGLSPIFACGLAAMQGLKIQGNSAKFFENMSRPSGILTAPGQISDETAKRLKDSWEANFGGDKIGRVAVLGDAIKYEAMSVNAVDAQLVEQLKMSGEMVCSVFHVPGYKVGVGQTPTYQNAEVLNQIYYSDCIQVQVESIEALLDEDLGIHKAGYRVEFDLDALLRMDSATKIKMLGEAVGAAIMAPNEARKKLDLPPAEGGDTPYLQQQNYSLAALDKRDSGGDPFGTAKPPEPASPAEEQVRAISDRARREVQAEIAAQKQAEETAMREFAYALKHRLSLHDGEA